MELTASTAPVNGLGVSFPTQGFMSSNFWADVVFLPKYCGGLALLGRHSSGNLSNLDHEHHGFIGFRKLDDSLDGYDQTSFTATVQAGHSYNWWVHAANSAGLGKSTHASFSCP
jgi:hypothetical protein